MTFTDGHRVSTSTVQRALRRPGLPLPAGFRADRGGWARLRKRYCETRHAGGTGADRLTEGLRRVRDHPRRDLGICAVIDYASRYCLAATVTAASRHSDALGCLRRAVVGSERVLDLDALVPTAA